MRLLAILTLLIVPSLTWGACGGSDLRPTFSPEENAEIARRTKDIPFAKGNHWTATKNARTIHLIGTMHIDDPRMDALAERLRPVIQAADMVLVEATEADQKQLEKDMATKPELAFLQGKTLIDLLPPEDWEALAAAANARGIPPFMAAKFQPWYLSLILAISPCTFGEIAQGAKGLDHRIMQIAQAADVPTASLEPPTTVFELFGSDPIEEQIDLLLLGILPDTLSENATATLIAQYFEEDHVAVLEASRIIARPVVHLPPAEFDMVFDEFIALLVDARNQSWMAPIQEAKGDTIVVAAGALHLGGKNGLLNLLAQRGYTLERQAF